MRKEFGKIIVELAEKDEKIYLLTGDIGYGVFDEFRRRFPDRFINMGIREQAMISFASGMALEGLKPYVYTITPFLIERPFEQIKLDIVMQNVNVKLIGYADYPTMGPTHTEIDPRGWINDLNIFAKSYGKNNQNILNAYFPKDSQETRQAIIESYNSQKPTFISLKKDKKPVEIIKTKGVYSHQKIAFHKEKLKSLAEGRITSPPYVRVKPTNRCNHRCFYCSYDPDFGYLLSEKKYILDEIPREKMMEILDDFKEMGVKAITYSGGGEPLVYPYIEECLQKNIDDGIDISIITNGQSLSGKKAELLAKAKWVRISADSCTPEIFVATRRIPERFFYELENNLRNFAKIKNPDCEFGINFVVNEKNAQYVLESTKYFKSLGLNHIRFSPVFIPKGHKDCPEGSNKYHAPFRESVLAQIKKAKELEDENFTVYDFYETDFDSSLICQRKYHKCFMMQVTPVIAANSSVYFCHDKAYSDSGLLGSIKNRSFKDLWFSPEAKRIFDTFDPMKGCQHHCTADGRNLAIQEMILDIDNLEKYTPKSEKHKNFI